MEKVVRLMSTGISISFHSLPRSLSLTAFIEMREGEKKPDWTHSHRSPLTPDISFLPLPPPASLEPGAVYPQHGFVADHRGVVHDGVLFIQSEFAKINLSSSLISQISPTQ